MTEQGPDGRTGRHCVLVTGMHRSGTSAAARVLNLLGAMLPEHLVGEDDGNPLGHWEPARVVELNDALLNEVAQGWDDVAAIDWDNVPADWFARAVASACGVLDAEYPTAPLFVVKDPRISRLLPVWRAAFDRLGITLSLLHCLRDPLEVAQSLQSRDGLSLPYALLLLARYTLDCQTHGDGLRRTSLAYADLLDDWRAAVADLEVALKLTLPVTDEAAAAITAFLTPTMRHHRRAGADTLPTAVAAIFVAVQNGDANPARLGDLSEALDARAADPNLLRQEIAARARRARRTRLEIAELRGYIGTIQPEVEQLRAMLSGQAREVGLVDIGPAVQAALVNPLDGLKQDLRGEIAAVKEALATPLAAIDGTVTRAISELEQDLRGETTALRQSFSAPFAAVESAIGAIADRIGALQRDAATHQAEIRLHEDRASLLTEALERARAETADALARIDALETARGRLDAEITVARQERDAAEAQARALVGAEEELLALRDAYGGLVEAQLRLQAELAAARQELITTERRADRLATDLHNVTRNSSTSLDRPASFGRATAWYALADTSFDREKEKTK